MLHLLKGVGCKVKKLIEVGAWVLRGVLVLLQCVLWSRVPPVEAIDVGQVLPVVLPQSSNWGPA